MLGEPNNQFSLTSAALGTSGRAKSRFLSVRLRQIPAAHVGQPGYAQRHIRCALREPYRSPQDTFHRPVFARRVRRGYGLIQSLLHRVQIVRRVVFGGGAF